MNSRSMLGLVLMIAPGICLPPPSHAVPEAQALYRQMTRADFVEGRFEQQRELSDIPAPVRSRGRFMIWRGHGLYWETTTPFFHATTFTTDSTFQWNDPGVAEPMDPGAFQINQRISSIILALFEGDFKRLKNDFSVSVDEKDGGWTVTLEPENRYIEKALERIVIRGESNIEHVRLRSASGDVTTIDLDVTARGDGPDERATARLSADAIRRCCLKRD